MNWEKLYSFTGKTIRHIHLIQYDSFSNKLWFSTGDKDLECLMGFTDFDFSKIRLIGKGDQSWRTLEILFEKDKIFWGTENPNGCNHLISLDRQTNKQYLLGKFSAPIYSLKKISCGYLALTPVEYGVGDIDKKAHVWFSSRLDSGNWNKTLSYKKDQFPLIFGFGRLSFAGEIGDMLFFSAQCLKDVDNSTIILRKQQ
ncbi:MAG: hypothetical protein PHY05_01005 [Methanothrix sp.]|nr:hypothetical protein [Methanothrix sp.]